MLRALTKLVILGLCYPLAASAAELTNGVNDRVVFTSISGMQLTEPSLKTLAMTIEEDASYYSVRASVNLTDDDFRALTRRRTFFDWWDSEEPSYDVWKGTVLLDGAYDEFVPEPSSVQYSIYIHNRTHSVRRLYLLTSESADTHRLYFYYVSTAQRVMMCDAGDGTVVMLCDSEGGVGVMSCDSGDGAVEKNTLPQKKGADDLEGQKGVDNE